MFTKPSLLFSLDFDGQAEVGQLDGGPLLLGREQQVFRLQVSVDDAVHVAVVDTLQDLLDAVRRVRLGVELARDDVLKELAARHAERSPFGQKNMFEKQPLAGLGEIYRSLASYRNFQ